MRFSFTSTGFSITYTQMTDRGQMDVYVVGVFLETINDQGLAQWQKSWISGSFTSGTHSVLLVQKTNDVVDVDAITDVQ